MISPANNCSAPPNETIQAVDFWRAKFHQAILDRFLQIEPLFSMAETASATFQPSCCLMAEEIRSFALLESVSESGETIAELASDPLEMLSLRTSMRSAIALRLNLRHIPHIIICNRSSIR